MQPIVLLDVASRLLTGSKTYFRLPEFAGCFCAGRPSTGMHVSKCPVFVAGALLLADRVLHSTRTMRNVHEVVSWRSGIGFASTTCHIGAMRKSTSPPSTPTHQSFELSNANFPALGAMFCYGKNHKNPLTPGVQCRDG